MALNENIPIDGDGVTTGTRVSEICTAIRTLRTSLNDGGLDTLYAVSYATTWISRSDWTNVHIGSSTTKNADSDINHALGISLLNLNVKVLISTDGTDNNSFEIIDSDFTSAGSAQTGITAFQVDTNNITIQSGTDGIDYIAGNGGTVLIDSEDWFYKIKVWEIA